MYLYNLANKVNQVASRAAVPKARSGNGCPPKGAVSLYRFSSFTALQAGPTLELVGPKPVCPTEIICMGQFTPPSLWGPGLAPECPQKC